LDAFTIGLAFLGMLDDGMTIRDIAHETQWPRTTIHRYLQLARANPWARLPRDLPRVWAVENANEKPCDHAEIPIPRGDAIYCAGCSRCGYDGHPKLMIRPKFTPPKKKPSLAARRFSGKSQHAIASV
jgi:hypothetical protein